MDTFTGRQLVAAFTMNNSVSMQLRFWCLLVLFGITRAETPLLTERPEWLDMCKRSDPNLNDCMKNGLQKMFRALAKGLPEIEMEPFEPLLIKKIGVSKGQGAVSITGAMEELYVHGPSNVTITYVKLDLKSGNWEFGLAVPYLRLESHYNLKGNILVLPVVGAGESTIHLWDCKCRVTTKIEMNELDGREIIQVPTMDVDFSVGGLRLHLNNLFNGNKVLGQTVNTFLNKNALTVVEELKGDIGKALAEVFLVILNKAFKHLPTDLWLPNQ